MTAKQLGRGVGLERGEAVGRRVWRGDEWRCGLCVRCRSLPGMSHVAVLKGETLPPRREGLHPRTIDAPHRHMAFGPHTPLPWQPAVRSCLLPPFRISGGLGGYPPAAGGPPVPSDLYRQDLTAGNTPKGASF